MEKYRGLCERNFNWHISELANTIRPGHIQYTRGCIVRIGYKPVIEVLSTLKHLIQHFIYFAIR